LASKGITTIGIDSDRKKCSKIAKGIPTFFETNLGVSILSGNVLINSSLLTLFSFSIYF